MRNKILGAAALIMIALVPVAQANAATVLSIGQLYNGGNATSFDASIDTRPSAQAFGKALARLGYVADVKLTGQSAASVIHELPSATVVAFFDHARGGMMATGGGGTTSCGPYVITGARQPYKYCGQKQWALGNLPPNSLRGVRLIIFGGCLTADNGASYDGNLMKEATRLGAQAVIGFRGNVHLASPGKRWANTSGNFFWEHFSRYVGRGATLRGAWRHALHDMQVSKIYHGHLLGYNTLAFGGTAKDPGGLRLTSP